ncbi:hypothetical protein ME9_01621 [Bartonella taylorii 8TBB]|uniref:Trimeric autotransporter adhesin YadA-like C-terminal membrane anchor domain-containing protein n=1 Tax=Bartonella taylorii 8TBB TaxID=1094560 RepID=A0A9P2RY95_BARTA|nr:YadA-like family protein [Bartonella taylorii]EJF92163.1 hypothetical protein ME9_01621 [Bartonella taylorii 8TBB]
MKKVYAKLAERKLNFFRPFYKASFVKMLSLSSIVALLSSASPVYSKTVAPKEAFLISAKSSSIVFPQSVISVYDDYNVEASDQENYVTALQGENTLAASAVSDYVNFLTTTFFRKSHDNAIINILTVYNSFARVIGYGSDLGLWGTSSLLEENYPTKFKVETFGDISTRDTGDPDPDRSYQAGDQASAGGKNAIAIGYTAKARDKDNIAIGARAEAKGYSSVAIGSEYTVQDPTEHTSAIDDYTTAVGAIAMSTKFGASSFGHRSYATNKEALSLGFKSVANVETSVALGAESVANISAGVAGYAPLLQGKSTDSEIAWKSTMGAVSVGYVAWKKTRQITAVAAGFEDTDAVNVAQLKSLQGYVNKGWKLSVDDKNATVVSIDDTVDFSAGSNNFTITKGEDDNNVKFDLAKSITVDKIETGNNTLDATGLIITGGPKITTAGIDAGSKKITGVEKGTDANDAVNFSQLKEIKEQVASSGLVAQDAQTKDITIGKEADGDKIDILNNKGKNRVLSGITNGIISDASTEAITGQQLYQLGTSIAGSLGGGASFSGGTWTAPKFKVKTVKADGEEGEETVYDDVASALAGVGNSFKDIKNEITNVVTKVEGDSLSWSKEANAFVAKHGAEDAKTSSKITFLANGDISKDSTDAINGSQLYSLGDTFAKYFGGGAEYKDGNWHAPTFTVKVFDKNGKVAEEKFENVSAAFTGVSNSFTNLDQKIENIVINTTGEGLVKQDTSGLITIGGKVYGAQVSIANVNNMARTLSGVESGSIAASSTDAINGSQIYTLSDTVAGYFSSQAGYDEDGNWKVPTFTVKVFEQGGKGTEKDYYNVADAFSGVNTSFTNLNKKIESVSGDSFVKQNAAGLITIGGSKGGTKMDISNNVHAPRILSGIKGGEFSRTSTEAVNGAQLYFITKRFGDYFGGGAGFDEKGKWSGPTFTVKTFDKDGNETEETYTNVADAFAGVSSTFATLNGEIVKIKDEAIIGQKHKDDDSDADNVLGNSDFFGRSLFARRSTRAQSKEKAPTTLTIAAKSPLAQVSFMNSEGKSRRLFDISAGDVSVNSSDAINGAQLYSISNQIAAYFGGGSGYKDGNWKAPTFIVKSFDKNGNETENKYTNVADALSGVNSAFASLNSQIVDIRNGSVVGKSIISQGRLPLKRLARNIGEGQSPTEIERNDVTGALSGMNNALTNINDRLAKVEQRGASDGLQWSEEKGAYDASHGGNAGKITNVDNGEVKQGSKDAVNGSQLSETNDRVKKVEAQVSHAVSYKVDKNGNQINKIELTGANDSDPVLIDNVANGEIERDSKTAVNGGQLYERTEAVLNKAKDYTDDKIKEVLGNGMGNGLNEAKSYTDTKFEALSYDIKDVRKEARQAAAIGLAVSNLRYFDDPGSLSLSFGSGLWRGQSAFAIGAGYTSEDGKIRSNLSVTSAGGQWGVGGGITLRLK